jgi:hypothetical protein
MPCSPHSPRLGLSHDVWEWIQIMKVLIVQLPPLSLHIIPLRSKYFSRNLVLKHPQSSLSVRDQVLFESNIGNSKLLLSITSTMQVNALHCVSSGDKVWVQRFRINYSVKQRQTLLRVIYLTTATWISPHQQLFSPIKSQYIPRGQRYHARRQQLTKLPWQSLIN